MTYSMLSMDIKYTVAMGNAMESIKRIARCQTRSNIQDGVAYAIENPGSNQGGQGVLGL